MDFIGTFQFAEPDFKNRRKSRYATFMRKKRYATFMLLVEATDIETAAEKFKAAIRRLKRSDEAFSEAKEVYANALIQVMSFPEKPILAYFESGRMVRKGWTGIFEFGKDNRYFECFAYGDEDDEREGRTGEPFVTFEG